MDVQQTSRTRHGENEPQGGLAVGAPAPLLVDEATAAQMLSISQRTLYTLRKQGRIAFVPLGRQRGIRYDVAELESFVVRERRFEGSHAT